MPPVSQAQRRWAWANKDRNAAAAEYATADPGGKLPTRVSKGHGVRRDHTSKGKSGQRKSWRGR